MKTTRLAAVILALLSAACSSPAGPSPAGPSVTAPTGTWGGFFRIDSCSPDCREPAGTQYAFLLDITDDGAMIRASLTSEMPRATTASFTGALRGDGSVVLTQASPASNVQIAFSEIVVGRAGDGVTGTLAYQDGTRDIAASIPSASRTAPAAAPTGSAFDLVGSWTGALRHDSCTGPHCSTTYPRDGDPYVLTVTREGDVLKALLRIDFHDFALTGTPQPDGSALFTGGPPEPASATTYDLEMRRFVLRRDAAAGLTGTLHWRFFTEAGTTNPRATILTGTRRDTVLLPGPFQGTWKGLSAVRGCSGDCRPGITGGEWIGFELNLSERGGVVTGRGTGFNDGYPVSGTATGRTLRLTGGRTWGCEPSWEGGYCSVRLRNFTATVDSLGQMRGTFYFDLVHTYWQKSTYTLRLELIDMIRQPTLLK